MTQRSDPFSRRATGYRRLARNTVATLAGRTAAIVLALALSTVLFRVLGQEQFGLWSLFAFLVGYSALIDFGLAAAVERQVAFLSAHERANEIARTVGQALLVVLAASCALQLLVTGSTVVLGSWRGRPVPLEVLRGLRVLPAALALTTGSLVVGGGLSGLQRMVALYAWRVGGMAVGAATAAGLALAGVTRLDVLLMGYAAGAPLAATGQWWSLRLALPAATGRAQGPHAWRWHGPTLGELFRFGSVLQMATLAPMLGEYAFRIIISQRFGVAYAGIFDLATRAALGLRSLASALFVVMVPFGVPLLATDERSQARQLIRLAVKYTGLFMLPSSLLLYVVLDPVVHLWLGAGPGAAQVAALLRPLVILHALVSLTVPMAMLGRSAGLPVPEAVTTWGGVLIGLGVSVLARGFSAAVVLFAAAPLGAGIVLWAWLARRLGVPFEGLRDLLTVGAVAATGGAVAAGTERLATWAGAAPMWAACGAVVTGTMIAVAVTHQLRVVQPRERTLLLGLFRPNER